MSGELAPWRTENTRTLLKDRWMDLRAERCVTQRGAVLDPYYVLDYPDWVHVAALDANDHLLLVRQYRQGTRSVTLELPGGLMDPGDADPVAAGARELLEETGHTAESFAHVARLSPNPATHANGLHIILALGARPAQAQSLDASEDILVERLPWRRALEMALAGEMVNAAHVGLLCMALARVKGAPYAG